MPTDDCLAVRESSVDEERRNRGNLKKGVDTAFERVSNVYVYGVLGI